MYFLLLRGLSDIADISSIPQINNKHINPLQISISPLSEQSIIVRFLDKKTIEIDCTIFIKNSLTSSSIGRIKYFIKRVHE